MPRPSPASPARWPRLTPERKCTPSSMLASVFDWRSTVPLTCYPASDVFSVERFSGCLSLDFVAFRKHNNVSVWIYAKFTAGKELTVWQRWSNNSSSLLALDSAAIWTLVKLQSCKVTFKSVNWAGKISCRALIALSLSQYWYWLPFRKSLYFSSMGFLDQPAQRNWSVFQRWKECSKCPVWQV